MSSSIDSNKVLDLPLKKEWYKMIESGEKREEYREIKPFWLKRLFRVVDFHHTHYENIDSECVNFYTNNIDLLELDFYLGGFQIKDFTHVRFRYGYTKRIMTYEIENISIGVGNPKWGAPDCKVIIIKIGERID